jgi:hypothetical protein
MRVYMAGSGRGALAPALGPPLAPTEVAEEDGKLGIWSTHRTHRAEGEEGAVGDGVSERG